MLFFSPRATRIKSNVSGLKRLTYHRGTMESLNTCFKVPLLSLLQVSLLEAYSSKLLWAIHLNCDPTSQKSETNSKPNNLFSRQAEVSYSDQYYASIIILIMLRLRHYKLCLRVIGNACSQNRYAIIAINFLPLSRVCIHPHIKPVR